jgi:hypothetical protein
MRIMLANTPPQTNGMMRSRLSPQDPLLASNRVSHHVGQSPSPRNDAHQAHHFKNVTASSELPADVAMLVTFTEEQKAVLRASRLSTVMRMAAAIYRNSKGSAETYKLSEEVSAIDFFVSHNWVIGRIVKFVALSVFFNLNIAIVVTLSYYLVMGLLGFFGYLTPLMSHPDGTSDSVLIQATVVTGHAGVYAEQKISLCLDIYIYMCVTVGCFQAWLYTHD